MEFSEAFGSVNEGGMIYFVDDKSYRVMDDREYRGTSDVDLERCSRSRFGVFGRGSKSLDTEQGYVSIRGKILT